MPRLLLLVLLSVSAACTGHSRPYYGGHLIEEPKLSEQRRSDLVLSLESALTKNEVKRIEIKTPEDRVVFYPGTRAGVELDWLPLPALVGVRRILNKRHRGEEVDFLTRIDTSEYVPVTAQHEMDDSIFVSIGKPRRSLTEQLVELLPQQISAMYGTGPIESGTAEWTASELAALQQALATLSAKERAQLAYVRFVRSHRSIRPTGKQAEEKLWGQYVSEAGRRSIYLYDASFAPDEHLFIGTPDQPLLATTECLLHEIGHAIADMTTAPQPNQSQALTGYDSGNLPAADSVLRAYDEVRGALRGPTPYGATALAESFAEAFALFHADPAALSRVAPRVHEWFLTEGPLLARTQAMAQARVQEP